jgi:hypothetical protein
MKWIGAMLLSTVFLLTSVPAIHAVQSSASAQSREADNQDKHRKKRRDPVPEGSAGVILALAAGALGTSVLVWRRKGSRTA